LPAATFLRSSQMTQIDWFRALDSGEKIVTILAIIVGGFGAYWRFFKGRTYHNRLQPEVAGKLVRKGELNCLWVTMRLKNVGVSSVYLKKDGTRIDVFYAAEHNAQTTHLGIWQHLKTFRIFENCKWIESGEAAKDELLIHIPGELPVAFKIDMTVNSTKDISFRSRAIVGSWDEKNNSLGKDEGHDSNE
jgi:hypothetical protein